MVLSSSIPSRVRHRPFWHVLVYFATAASAAASGGNAQCSDADCSRQWSVARSAVCDARCSSRYAGRGQCRGAVGPGRAARVARSGRRPTMTVPSLRWLKSDYVTIYLQKRMGLVNPLVVLATGTTAVDKSIDIWILDIGMMMNLAMIWWKSVELMFSFNSNRNSNELKLYRFFFDIT